MFLPITGPTYEHPSRDVNYQRCVNLFPSPVGPQGRDADKGNEFCLLPRAGYKEFIDLTGSEVRGIFNFDDSIFVVVDNAVYKLTIDEDAETATGASLGTINSSTGPVSMARNDTQIIITTPNLDDKYIITVSSNTLTQITDTDLPLVSDVVFMDSYFIASEASSASLYASALDDGTSWAATDVATAEGTPDDIVGLAVDKRELWVFGKSSIEIWYNAANSSGFPFTRREGAFIDQGCAAKHSILNFDNTLMWLDDRGYVVKVEGYTPRVVSSLAVSNAIKSYKVIEDAIAFSQLDRGHLFYVITFPTAKKTWAYDALTEQWHERAYYDPNEHKFTQDLGQVSTRYKTFELVGARNSGKIFLVKADHFKDDADLIHCVRTTAHSSIENKFIGISELEIHLEAGKGLTSGTGSDPQIMMRYSNDGGYSFSNELVRSMGKRGEYAERIYWNRLGSGREWLFEFRISSPIPFALISAFAQVNGGK